MDELERKNLKKYRYVNQVVISEEESGESMSASSGSEIDIYQMSNQEQSLHSIEIDLLNSPELSYERRILIVDD